MVHLIWHHVHFYMYHRRGRSPSDWLHILTVKKSVGEVPLDVSVILILGGDIAYIINYKDTENA